MSLHAYGRAMHSARPLGPISSAATVLTLLLATACGSTESASGDGGPASLPDDTYRRVLAQGVDPAAVYTIELPGFELAEQSAGVLGDSDYAATYVPDEAPYTTEVRFQVRSGTYDAATCERDPLQGPSGGTPAPVESCEPDADGWYRTGGGWHDYVVLDAGHQLIVGAPSDEVDRDELVAAALGARHQDGDAISPAPPSEPVPRGDLPTTGDGAPVDPYDPDKAGG